MVITASGALAANVSGYTGAGGIWTRTATPTTLYAKWTLDSYSVIYTSGQHGSITGSTTADYEMRYTDKLIPDTGYSLPDSITMTMGGSSFMGSDYSSTTGEISIAKNKITGDIVITGACTPNSYTVEYCGNGSNGGSMSNSAHTYDAAKALTANGFTRAYKVTYTYSGATGGHSAADATATYSFKEWTTAADGSGNKYTNSQSVTNLAASGTFKLYAQWNSAAVTLPTPTRTGYTFGGWYSNSACSDDKRVGGGGNSYTPTAPITLYAKWMLRPYSSVYTDGQHGSITGSTALNYDTAYSDKLVPNTGYSLPTTVTMTMGSAPFTDFSYSSATGEISIAKNKLTGDIVITGACTPNGYTVRYNGAGATGGATADSVHVYDAAKALNPNGFTRIYKIAYDHNYSGSANTGAAAAYVFTGWGTTAGGGGTGYANGQSVTNLATSGIFDLYAKWTPTSVTLPTPARADYSFGGWYRDPACTEASRVGGGGASYTPTTDITLYAKWTLIPFTVEKHESTDETPTPQETGAPAVPAAPKVYDYGEGQITVIVPPDEDVVLAQLPDKQTVIESSLTPDEFETVANGSTIDIKLDVKRVKDELPTEEKQAIESAVEDFSQEVEGLTMGLHLDISLAKRIDGGDWQPIPDSGKPLTVVIQLPEEMIIPGVEYYIIRNHEGGCTLLRDQDNDPATITILTQYFSAYAIAYKPAKNTACLWLWLLLLLIVLLVTAVYIRNKLKKEKLNASQK